MTADRDGSTIRIEIPIDSADDVATLRGSLLKARATELSELQRRAGRNNLGYGSDSARGSIDEEARSLRRRIELLDALIAELDRPV